jgi:hypothetical protein
MSFNLHILLCRLNEQSEERGHPGFENELWMERGIQSMKSATRYRCSSNPEKVAVNGILWNDALLLGKVHFGLKTIAEMEPVTEVSKTIDTYPTFDSCMLIGPALNRISKDDRALDVDQVKVFIKSDEGRRISCGFGDDGIEVLLDVNEADIDWETMREYSRADKRNDEIIMSEAYPRAQSRVNYWVMVRFGNEKTVGDGKQDSYMACVSRFLLVTGKKDGISFVLRLAVCKLWKLASSKFGGDVCIIRKSMQWKYTPREAALNMSSSNCYPVLVSKLDCKMNIAVPKHMPLPDTCKKHKAHNNRIKILNDTLFFMKPFVVSRRL